jgi:hypothetical protein
MPQRGAGIMFGSFTCNVDADSYSNWSCSLTGAGWFGFPSEGSTPSDSFIDYSTPTFFSTTDATTNDFLGPPLRFAFGERGSK